MGKYNNINKGGRGKKVDYETKVVRLPIDLIPILDQVLEYYLTNNYTLPEITLGDNIPEKNINSDVLDKINQIKENIKNNESGYRKNSASQLIKDIKNL